MRAGFARPTRISSPARKPRFALAYAPALPPGVLSRVGGQFLPALLPCCVEALVGLGGYRLELALELAPAADAVEGECSVVDGREHCAAGLAGVCAVAEAAVGGQRLDVLERRGHVPVPELQLAEPGCVDGERAAGQVHELAVRRRVPPGAVRG